MTQSSVEGLCDPTESVVVVLMFGTVGLQEVFFK